MNLFDKQKIITIEDDGRNLQFILNKMNVIECLSLTTKLSNILNADFLNVLFTGNVQIEDCAGLLGVFDGYTDSLLSMILPHILYTDGRSPNKRMTASKHLTNKDTDLIDRYINNLDNLLIIIYEWLIFNYQGQFEQLKKKIASLAENSLKETVEE